MNRIQGEPAEVRSRRYALQLAATWLAGSLILGMMASILLSAGSPGRLRPLVWRGPGEPVLAVLLLVALLGGLLAVGWLTREASWLTGDWRAAVLWAVVVAVFGFAGWVFAGVVSLVAEFPYGAQIALAYAGGGLPFALVAGMLQRPVRINVASALVAGTALLVGVLVAGVGLFPLVGLVLQTVWQLFLPIVAR